MPRFTITLSEEDIVALYKKAERSGNTFSEEAACIVSAALREEIPEPSAGELRASAEQAFAREQKQQVEEDELNVLKSIRDMLGEFVRATRPQMRACLVTHPASGQQCSKPWGHIAVPGDAPHQFPTPHRPRQESPR